VLKRLKNKTWTNPQIKSYKNGHALRLTRPQTTQKPRTPTFKIINTTDTICGKNCESSSWVQVQKIYMYYLVSVDHNGMAVHLTRSGCEGFYEVLYG